MTAPAFSRLLSLFRKEMLETFRDWKMLSLTLTFAPFFVLLMYAYLGHSTPVYQIAVVNHDRGGIAREGVEEELGARLVEMLRGVQSPEGDTVLRVRLVTSGEVEGLLESRRVDVAITIPEGFSETLLAAREGRTTLPVPVRSRGDPANPDYLMAAVWADMTVMAFVEIASGLRSPALLAPETVSGTSSLTEFELYVPGLLALALMMLMFTAAGALIREKDKGTLIRLRLSNLTVFEWLTAVSCTQLIVGILALALTYLTAMGVGYKANGSLTILFVVGALTSISIMAFSVLVAAFLRTVFDLVTVGCFPFFILMFFSGGMFPLPGIALFHLGDRAVQINEVLPTTHAISAMNRVLSYDAALGDIAYELAAVVILSAVYYAVGTWIFTRRHMPAVG
ncbi:MAG: ABC transporter permease [Gemmatimonadota bacterium]|jgi:ABC-2 type transport system permease protein